jgi:hypothetical protein
VNKVINSSFSLKNAKAKSAVINGIALMVKSAFATEVFVRACRKHMFAHPIKAPPKIPGQPIALICWSSGFFVVISRNIDMELINAIER